MDMIYVMVTMIMRFGSRLCYVIMIRSSRSRNVAMTRIFVLMIGYSVVLHVQLVSITSTPQEPFLIVEIRGVLSGPLGRMRYFGAVTLHPAEGKTGKDHASSLGHLGHPGCDGADWGDGKVSD